MASYPSCRECGNDLTTSEEEEQELCFGCQEQEQDCQEYLTKEDVKNWLRVLDEKAKICPKCITVLKEADGKLYCPNCDIRSQKLNGGRNADTMECLTG